MFKVTLAYWVPSGSARESLSAFVSLGSKLAKSGVTHIPWVTRDSIAMAEFIPLQARVSFRSSLSWLSSWKGNREGVVLAFARNAFIAWHSFHSKRSWRPFQPSRSWLPFFYKNEILFRD